MIATSKVHIGRLIFFLPILCLLVASGATTPIQLLARRIATRFNPRRAAQIGVIAASIVALLILPAVAAATWRDYRESPGLPPGAAVAEVLHGAAANRPPGIALILRGDQGEDPTEGVGEATEVAALRLSLDPYYHFIDLYHPERQAANARGNSLYYGNVLERLKTQTASSLPCDVDYYVARVALEPFLQAYEGRRERCGDAAIIMLP
jgi:hypothetical protein